MSSLTPSFTNKPGPDVHGKITPKILHELQKINRNIFLVLYRNTNNNIVIYELKHKNGVFMDPPVEAYWLILDDGEKHRGRRRKEGITHDREEFNFMEKRYGYGCNSSVTEDKKLVHFELRAKPEYKFYVRLNKKKTPYLYLSPTGEIVKNQSKSVQREYIIMTIFFETQLTKIASISDLIKTFQNPIKLTISGFDITENKKKPLPIVKVIDGKDI